MRIKTFSNHPHFGTTIRVISKAAFEDILTDHERRAPIPITREDIPTPLQIRRRWSGATRDAIQCINMSMASPEQWRGSLFHLYSRNVLRFFEATQETITEDLAELSHGSNPPSIILCGGLEQPAPGDFVVPQRKTALQLKTLGSRALMRQLLALLHETIPSDASTSTEPITPPAISKRQARYRKHDDEYTRQLKVQLDQLNSSVRDRLHLLCGARPMDSTIETSLIMNPRADEFIVAIQQKPHLKAGDTPLLRDILDFATLKRVFKTIRIPRGSQLLIGNDCIKGPYQRISSCFPKHRRHKQRISHKNTKKTPCT